MFRSAWVALAAALLVATAANAQITLTPPALLNNNAVIDSGDDERPQVVSDGNGTWIAVWDSFDSLGNQIGFDFDIFVSRSIDNGQTWSPLGVLNTNAVGDNGDDIRPILSTDNNGNWICVWESNATIGGVGGGDLDIVYTRSTDNGQNWTAPAFLNTNAATDSREDEIPFITTDGAGNWIAIWDSNENLNGTAGFDYDILYARSTNNGATWTAPALLNTNGTTDDGDDFRSQIITDNSGTWLAVWSSDDNVGGSGFDNDIVVSRSTNNGVTWTAPVVVNTNAVADFGFDYRPAIATDGAGNWVAAWHSNENLNGAGNDFDLFVSRSSDNGTTWTAPSFLNSNATTDSGDDEYVRVTTDALGNWIAVWNSNDSVGGTGFDYDVYYARSTNNGLTWSTIAPLSTTATTDFWIDLVPQVSTDGSGNWVAIWESNGDIDGNTTPDYDIVFSRFTLGALGLGATSIVPASTGPTNATSMSFTVAFSDSVVNFNNAADLVITHSGTASTGASISGGPENFTVNVTGITGTGSFTLAVSTASDVQALGGAPLVSSVTSAAVVIDNAAPGVALSSAAGDPVNGAITVNVALTENSANFTAGDIATSNATVSNFNGTGSAYSFTLTPAATGAFTASVGAGTFTDAAGNANTASNVLSRTADLSGPAITLTSVAGDPVTGPITVNAVLTQSTTNFVVGDIVTVNATVDEFSGSGTAYSFTLTPLANGLFSATVPAGSFTNGNGTGNSASNTLSRTANLPPPPTGADPTPSVVVHSSQNGDIGDDERPQVVTDGAGNWVMVWDVNLALNGAAGNDLDLLVTRSTDNGVTWSTPALLNTNGMTDSGQDIRPALATNNAGVWIAVWHSMENLNGTAGTDDDIFFARSTDAGATWSAPALLNTNGNGDGGNDEMPRIAADAAGNWVATWMSTSNIAANGTDFDVFVARSSDNGLTWSAPSVLNSNGMIDGATETRADIATDGAGTWIALWASDENLDGQSAFDYDILYSRSTNNGATWSASARLNTNATTDNGGDFRPAILTDRAGNWVAAWHSFGTAGGDLDVLVARSSNAGLTWSAPALLNQGGTTDSGDDDSVRLGTDEAGNWVAAWESTQNIGGNTGTDYDNFIARSTDNGATWSAPVLLNSNGTEDGSLDLVPYLASDRAGNWVAAWESTFDLGGTAGWDFDVVVSRFFLNPLTLSALSIVPDGSAGATSVNLTVTFSGDVVNFNNAADLVITHSGTANTGVTITGGPRVYTASITGISGNGSFTVAVSTASDVQSPSGAPLVSSVTSAPITLDTTPPTIALGSDAAATVNAPITVSAVLSEPSTNFVAADVTATNATVGNFAGGGTNYSFVLTPTASGAFSASVPAGRFTDAAGLNNLASNVLTRTADLTAPTATLSTTAASVVRTPITVNIVLSEASTNFAIGDLTLVNATASAFTGSGTNYSVTLTPVASGTFSVAINAGAFTDAIGNGNVASSVLSRTADLTPPTATLASTSANVVNGAIAVTVTLSEISTNFVSGDVTLTNCTISSFSGSGVAYVFALTPTQANGTFSAVINAGAFTDAVGNPSTVSNTLTRTVDTTRPTVTFSTTAPATVGAGAIPVVATLSEASTNFVAGDLTLTNSTVSGFSGSGTTYTFNLTPTNSGTFSVRANAGVFSDAAGNTNTASATLSRTADVTAPTATLSTTAATVVRTPITVNFVLSETSTNFAVADLTLVNATASAFTGSGTNYSVTLTPVASGTFSVTVPAGRFTDAVGNQNTASAVLSRTADLTAPTATLASTSGSVVNGPITVTVTLSETSTNFASGDVTRTNCNISNFTGSGTAYSFTLTPTITNGTFTAVVNAGAFTDAVGNPNTVSNTLTRTVAPQPTVTFTTTAPATVGAGPIPVVATLSAASTNFVAGDLTVTNATVSGFSGSGTNYTFNLTPTSNGTFSVRANAGVFTNASGAANTASATLSRTADLTGPTVSISGGSLFVSGPFTVTVTFNEPTTNFTAADINVSNGTVSNFTGSGSNYSFRMNPNTGISSLQIPAGTCTDQYGNQNSASNTLTRLRLF